MTRQEKIDDIFVNIMLLKESSQIALLQACANAMKEPPTKAG